MHYRIYCIGNDNKIISGHDFDVKDDIAAFDKAKELCGESEVEVWQGTRFVARLARDGTAS
jgi:hypothetical protein